jgi:hypothetical protein
MVIPGGCGVGTRRGGLQDGVTRGGVWGSRYSTSPYPSAWYWRRGGRAGGGRAARVKIRGMASSQNSGQKAKGKPWPGEKIKTYPIPPHVRSTHAGGGVLRAHLGGAQGDDLRDAGAYTSRCFAHSYARGGAGSGGTARASTRKPLSQVGRAECQSSYDPEWCVKRASGTDGLERRSSGPRLLLLGCAAPLLAPPRSMGKTTVPCVGTIRSISARRRARKTSHI